MAPMNIQLQNTIDEHGNIVQKDRLTHDQSYKWESSGTSFNSRIDKSTLQPCMFGSCLKRIANWAVATRRKHPSLKIFAQKVDIKSAYRRLHLNAALAIQTCTQLPELNLAIASLRATFGGTYGPYEWGVISESICDLANAILLNDDLGSQRCYVPRPRASATKNMPRRQHTFWAR